LNTIKVIVENNFVGEASSLSEASILARRMAYRLGYTGGNIKVKYINNDGALIGSASIYVT
jgi:hypothetical protein